MISGALRATANSSSDFCLPPPNTLQPASRIAGAMRRRALRMFIHSFRRLVTDQEGAEQQDNDADANRGIADIKDIKGPEHAKMKVQEVEYIAELHAVDDIPERSAQYHRQRQLVAARLFLANPPGHADRNCSRYSHQNPSLRVVLRLGEAEADSEIMDPCQVEDRQQVDLLAFELKPERLRDQPFRNLVGDEDQRGEQIGECALSHSPPPRSDCTARRPT